MAGSFDARESLLKKASDLTSELRPIIERIATGLYRNVRGMGLPTPWLLTFTSYWNSGTIYSPRAFRFMLGTVHQGT